LAGPSFDSRSSARDGRTTRIGPRDPGSVVPWIRVWQLAAITFAVAVSGLEAFWRIQGHRPSVPDDAELWAYYRSRVYADQVVVFIGASRMHAAIDVTTFAQQWPGFRAVQLSKTGGGSPIGTLIDLARDPRFHGVVVCDASEPFFSPLRWADQDALNRAAQQGKSLCASANTRRLLLYEYLATINPRLRLREVIKRVIARNCLPSPSYISMRFDRSFSLNSQCIDDFDAFRQRMSDSIMRENSSSILSSAQFAESLGLLTPYLRAIRDRGGIVVFVRLPSDGHIRRQEHRVFPRTKYWDQLTALVDAKTVYYEDYPSLARFHCPDESHLDGTDSPRFTIALAKILSQVINHDGWST
jgi:hypothetical protein